MATTTSTTATNDVAEGPVLSVVNKRLRALRKKMNRIVHTEESVAQGKPINKEQEEVLRSKPSVLALIDELEKLRSPLSAAVTEELNLALKDNNNHHQQPKPQPEPESQSQPQPQPQSEPASEPRNDDVSVVEDLINLIYFGSLFDVESQNEFTSTMLTRTHERGCCLTYDYVTDDATDLLRERDLDLISAMRGLLISRPANSSLSHRDALRRCLEHARLWLARAQQPIEPNAEVTYAGLREKLNKIMSSEYITTTPEIKATVEVAAAAASGSYHQSFQVPVHVETVEAEGGSVSQSQDQDEGTINYQGYGSGEQSDPEGELQKDEVEVENLEVVATQHEQNNPHVDVEYNQRDMEAKDQQYYPRRGYQNHRGGRGSGGGRRGYSNGRGGRGGAGGGGGRGGYQNGRNQYYDQSGNYYPRNYYNRGGRGGRGGYYNNNGSGGQFNHVAGDVGVQS
ncbi:hypothetical protein PIB30_078146 [Stylosanthes scabra]|uniref:Glycine-rich protein n=1 Tax=Stylosanthes scabra TaxID=79078 RepID=A0ABU6QRC8_9FABA|nr:hypothetical protein [Stylosanthes scabra]